ncbi:MAG TPA: nicotinamide riboside transporter PnuC [Rudaea sp.]|jgi:nicotinamide mononucleotide transporter|uniref:nicotinamide riboside transporter PnuC n=1 Tax=Rudaea sp. TaxID=2136325 RepID=UPI002F925AC7
MLSALADFLGATAFSALNTPVSNAEVIGFVAGVACVWLAARQNVLNFPLAIVNTTTFLLLFTDKKLYGDAGLQAMFLSLNVYGWRRWFAGDGEHHALAVSRLSLRGWILVAAIALIAVPLLQQVLIRINGAAPFWDAVITSLSVIAQVLLNRKTLENWALWIVVDLISIPVYISKDLYLTAVLYAIFLLLCVNGWVAWRRSFAEGPTAASATAAA